MRPVRRGAGRGPGRGRRRLLRARRPFAAGDAADQPRACGAGCGAGAPQRVRGADGGGLAQRLGRDGTRRVLRCGRWRARPRSRCRMRSGGCGSWIGWRAAARPTRSRWRCGLTGALDVAALEGALGDLVERHESLRTVFPERVGVPRQEILTSGRGPVRPDGDAGRRGGACRSSVRRSRRGFDLCGELPLRAHVFGLAGRRACAAAGAASHRGRRLVAGGAGAGPRRGLCGALPGQACGCASCASGAVCRLHAVAARGAGRRGRPDSALARQLGYWRRRLQGLPEQLDLACDRPRPAVASYRGDTVRCSCVPSCTAACWSWRGSPGRACSWCCRPGLRRC